MARSTPARRAFGARIAKTAVASAFRPFSRSAVSAAARRTGSGIVAARAFQLSISLRANGRTRRS